MCKCDDDHNSMTHLLRILDIDSILIILLFTYPKLNEATENMAYPLNNAYQEINKKYGAFYN